MVKFNHQKRRHKNKETKTITKRSVKQENKIKGDEGETKQTEEQANAFQINPFPAKAAEPQERRFNMMKKMNKKGFTLAELLIVVAIIAILVAVSVPIFTAQLEKAREATDLANMRAAKGAAVTAILAEDTSDEVYKALASNGTVYYDADKGVLKTTAPEKKYGKGTDTTGNKDNTEMGYDPGKDYTNQVVTISYDSKNDKLTIGWSN